MPRKTLLRTLAAVVAIGALVLAGQASFGRSTSRRSIRVAWGDSLWALSQRYGVSMSQLAAANHMRVSDVLFAGRTLYLPTPPGGATAAATPARAVAAAPTAKQVQQTFCSTYRPPTQPHGQLPASLTSDPSRLALRPVFAQWAKTYGVPLDLMEAEAWQESGWQNSAVSPAGAVGIGQLLPGTAVFVNQSLGTNLRLSVPSDNIRMMAAFLGYLLHATGGQVCSAVASYYQGLGTTMNYGILQVSQVYVRDVLSLRPRFA
jgi:N-acetylmuramoyl-L-alanine amidase